MLSFLASFILAVIKFFSNFNEEYENFYEKCEDYLSSNIKNGRVLYDIARLQKDTSSSLKDFSKKQYRSEQATALRSSILKILSYLASIPVINITLLAFLKFSLIISKYIWYHLILIFILYPVLAYFFRSATNQISLFFTLLIPFITIFILLETGLLMFINNPSQKTELSLLGSYISLTKNIRTLLFAPLVYISVSSISSLILIYLFIFTTGNIAGIADNSITLFGYLLIVSLLTISILFFLFYAFILSAYSFLSANLEKTKSIDSLSKAKNIISALPLFSPFIFLLFFLTNFSILSFAFIHLSDFGLTSILTISLHLSFWLITSVFQTATKILPLQIQSRSSTVKIDSSIIGVITLITAIASYSLLGNTFLSVYPSYRALYDAYKFNLEFEKNFSTFENQKYGYSIRYPKIWNLYPQKDELVTIQHNLNNTTSGELTIEIKVIPEDQTDFTRLSRLAVTTIMSNTQTGENITKLADLSLEGHTVVKYDLVQQTFDRTLYQRTYIIQKDGFVYQLSFNSKNQLFFQQNAETLEAIFSTFNFTTQSSQ